MKQRYNISELLEKLQKGNAIDFAKATHWGSSPLYAATRNGWLIQYHPVAHYDVDWFLKQHNDELDDTVLYIHENNDYKPISWERVVYTGGRYGELLILGENQMYKWLSSNGWYKSYISPYTGSQYVIVDTYGSRYIYPGKVLSEHKATVHGLSKVKTHQRIIVIEQVEQAKGKFLISHDWIVEIGDNGYKAIVPEDLDLGEYIQLNKEFKYTGIEKVKDYLYRVGKIGKINVYAWFKISDPQETFYIFKRKPKCYVIVDEMRKIEL